MRKGFISVVTLVILTIAFSVSSLALLPANKIFANNTLLVNLFRREDIALQALMIGERWLRSSISDGVVPPPPDDEKEPPPNYSPMYDVPDDKLAPLLEKNVGAKVTARVIDMYYSSASQTIDEAEAPLIKPDRFTVSDDLSGLSRYGARYYLIDVAVSIGDAPYSKVSLQREISVVKDGGGNIYLIRGNTRKGFI
ncbi:MAG: hypothetical protein Q4F74_05520 [Synergistaceae bacterium]|nr:hypothetical protein [Synergistaceae bacterium]